MITTISPKKFEAEIVEFAKKDDYEDFYITIDRKRKFFDDNKVIQQYAKKLKRSEIALTDGKGNFLLTWGISSKGQRNYIKILTNDNYKAKSLLKILLWNWGNRDYYFKLKNNNPLIKVAKQMGFYFSGGRGKEVLLYRKKFISKKTEEKENDDSY